MFDTRVLDRSLKARRARLEEERGAVLERVLETLRGMRAECGIREAYAIGSLVRAGAWHAGSDVDVAVGGCSASVLEIMKALEDATGKQVDVVDLDRHPSADSFRRRGLCVYG
ncbi:MAG: nucleotidyltransferase domain-containing protein [Candidatus Latescibacterota bacterium]